MCGKKELPLLMASMICGALCSGGNAETMRFGELLCDNGETLILSAPARWEGKLNGSSIAVEFSENRCRIPCDCKQQNLAELEYMTREKNRYEKLYKSNAAAQTTYEDALRSYLVYEAKRDESKANLALAENDLSYTKIYAPLSGRIGRNIYSEGNYITPEKGVLATIVQFDPIKIKFAMSEADFFRHSKNGTLSVSGVEIVRADGKTYQGKIKVDFVDNQIDTKTGTLMIQLEGENPDMELIPGGYVMVRFREKFEKPLPSVSVTALMTDGTHHYVYVVTPENKVERRNITIGPQVRDRQIVLSGLKKGETVVIGGINKTKPGEQVNPVYGSALQ